MCVDAVVWRHNARAVRVGNIRQLAKAIGGEPVMDVNGYGDFLPAILATERHCLCPVDMPATAKRHGLKCFDPCWDSWHNDAWGLKGPEATARKPGVVVRDE